MLHRDRLILKKMLVVCEYVAEFVHGFTLESFMKDEKTKNAVAMTLVRIGELSSKFSDDFRKVNIGIPHREIRGMRNAVAHGYDVLRFDEIWYTATVDIPELKVKIEKHLSKPA